MAVTLVQKNIRRNGDLAQGHMTFLITGGGTVNASDYQIAINDGTGATLTFIPRFIDKVIVFNRNGTTDPTVDGLVYEVGTWDFYDMGGVPVSSTTSLTTDSGNILIKIRS